MTDAIADELLKAARIAAARSDVGDVLERIDRSLKNSSDGPAALGQLYLARALTLQCSTDLIGPAQAMDVAYSLLRGTPNIGMAAYAGAASAVLWQRLGDVERTVEYAVEALVMLGDADPRDVEAMSARNALAQVFRRLSAHELAIDLATEAFDADWVPLNVRAHYAFNFADTMIEATIALDTSNPLWLDRALEAAAFLDQGKLATTPMITAAIRGEVALLRGDKAAFRALDDDLDATTSEDPSIYPAAGPRLVAWHQLVRASGALQWGDPVVAITLLNRAAPALCEMGDTARHDRALEVRSLAKVAAHDPNGAAADALLLARSIRSTQAPQLGRVAALIARRAELERTRDRLLSKADRLEHEASVDLVTGLQSRRWLELRLDELSESDIKVGVVIVDLDRFKSINDNHGHAIGDQVLSAVGELLRATAPTGDHARFGGEEFVLLIENPGPDCTSKLAEAALERIRTHDWGALRQSLALTASAGVAVGSSRQVREVVRRADLALYEAKSRGRDQSSVASHARL